MDLGKQSIALHRRAKGKLSVVSRLPLKTKHDLSLLYTPGVGAVSSAIAQNLNETAALTIKNNAVAVISDGTAVLGLGNVGPEASLPVLEGKCVLFKEFAGIDAFPLALNATDPDVIVQTIKAVAPVFGGINLEDISAPRCFEIEQRLISELKMPVVHDDQHGTAIVVLAGLLGAARVARKRLKALSVVINGAGPAGTAVTKLLFAKGISAITILDSKGIIYKNRPKTEPYKQELGRLTKRTKGGGLAEALIGADVFIGLSRGNILTEAAIQQMAPRPIIFALANPVPEIEPKRARNAGAIVVATGRSDYPNQINNALVFPGLFRGALDRKVRMITAASKIRAAENLAALVKNPTAQKIIPSIFDRGVAAAVARAVR